MNSEIASVSLSNRDYPGHQIMTVIMAESMFFILCLLYKCIRCRGLRSALLIPINPACTGSIEGKFLGPRSLHLAKLSNRKLQLMKPEENIFVNSFVTTAIVVTIMYVSLLSRLVLSSTNNINIKTKNSPTDSNVNVLVCNTLTNSS